MNKNILITIKKELRGIVRDKKSLMMMLVGPIMIPIFIFLFSYVYDSISKKEEEQYTIGVNYELNDDEKDIVKELNLDVKEFTSIDEMKDEYSNHEIALYVIKDNAKYTVYSNPKSSDGSSATTLVNTYLNMYNDVLGQQYLNSIDIDSAKVYNNILVEFEELHGKNEMVDMLIFFGVVFAMMSITLTSVYGVTDTTAGEKERGTLETFLTFPIKSDELITGKYLAIVVSCIVTSIISSILVVLSIKISSGMFSIFDNASMNINILSVLITLVIMVSYSIFISGLCIAIASFSKTYKEAQSALTPINFITMVPMFFNILGINLSLGLSFVPVVSHTLLINECLTIGFESNSYLYLVIMFISTIIYSIVIIKIINKMYKSEKILFSL